MILKIYWIALSVLLYGCTTYYVTSTGDNLSFVPDAEIKIEKNNTERDDKSMHDEDQHRVHSASTDASKAISEVEHIINDELKIDTKIDNSSTTKEQTKTNNSKHETDIDVDMETKLK